MDRRDAYLLKAAELSELAHNARYTALKAQFEGLARAYLYLADQVKENRYKMPPPKEGDHLGARR
jgi:hypothetical protein